MATGRTALATWMLLLLLAIVAPFAQACDTVLPLAEARRTIVAPDGSVEAGLQALPDWILPSRRSERHRIRYRVDVSACAGDDHAALWIFRVGAPFELRDGQGQPLELLSGGASPIFGALLQHLHPDGEPQYNGRIPALFALKPGTREVELELLAPPYLPSGIVRASIGPANQLLSVQSRALDQVVASADAAAGIVLALGAIALLLWSQRRGDSALLWLAVASGLWGVRSVAYFGPRVLVGPLAFEQFNPLNVLLASTAVSASVLSLLGIRRRWLWRAIWGGTLLGLAALGLAALAGQGALIARAVAQAIGFAMIVTLIAGIVRVRTRLLHWHAAMLATGLAGLLGCAIHDMMVVAGRLPPDEPSYVFWGFVGMLIGFAAMTGQYVVATLNRAERTNEELEQRVATKSAELVDSYTRLRESEREAARIQERERLLRDMHDGLGAHLMTALRGVERGALGPQQVTQSLQDSLDELRLLMDSADMGHYLPGALAAWRNRWDHRLAAAGVALTWRIDESLDEVQLPGETALQVMRILQEAATNIVKHSQARQMVFDARVEDAGASAATLCITIADDGVGLPAQPGRTGSRGLKNMRHRAQQVGAMLATQGRDGGGTEVVLRLPVGRAAGIGVG